MSDPSRRFGTRILLWLADEVHILWAYVGDGVTVVKTSGEMGFPLGPGLAGSTRLNMT